MKPLRAFTGSRWIHLNLVDPGAAAPPSQISARFFTLSFLSDSVPGSLKITLCRRCHPEHTEKI
jgi:hypothetical protein